MPDLRPTIAAALADFESTPLAEAATGLFQIMGYSSDRLLDFPALREFLAQFDPEGKCAKRFPDMRAISTRQPIRLLQLTNEEISAGSSGQLQLLTSRATDLRLFDSYLFLILALPGQNYTRTDLADRTRVINSLFRQPVLVLFRYNDLISLAITYRRAGKRDRLRDIVDRKVTLIKDIKCSQPHRAHLDILADFSLDRLSSSQTPIATFADLDDAWRKSLSTQALNQRFYAELAAWYYWAVNTIRLPIIADYLKERPDADDENVKQFTIRLLCRTIFCWFLKERGLIDSRLLELTDAAGQVVKLVRNGANGAEFMAANSYYRGILQNIFFNSLNTPMKQRRHTAARAAHDRTVRDPKLRKMAYRGKQHLPEDFEYTLFDRIPYLNGGLFDVLPEDNATDSIDDAAIRVPNELFYAGDGTTFPHGNKRLAVKGLNRILDGYKFTIAENTPLEEEIALDPELLGLVFENLLAEVDTADTAASASARQASGTYYTPRRVIDYMVNEALCLHLENFVRARNASDDECLALQHLIYRNTFDPAQNRLAGWIVEAFDEIRILDPACGSGAFPMGALHRMVAILQRVDPENRRWLHRQVSHIPDRPLREAAETDLARHADDYSRKLGLIKNAVYGVDIQPLAVLITKLRFFISLLVDQTINLSDFENNYGLTPLPNLETKVLCANTLRDVQVSLFDSEAIRKYQAARDEYYQPETSANRRDELADAIAAALSELLPGFTKEVTKHEYKDKRTQDLRNRELLKEWFRHSTLPAPFFNFAVFFPEICADTPSATVAGELPLVNEAQTQHKLVTPGRKSAVSPRSGFDIVIGNPPYGGSKISDEVKTALRLGSKDPYGAFIARFMGDGKAPTPLRPDGVLAYIVSDTFMTIKTHRPLREQIMGSRLHKMIRVHPDTFSATVNTAIILLQKGGGPGTKPPTDDELATVWEHGPWCQMVDLTQVSIYEQHDRFLTLLFDTAGTGCRRDIATESCAVYHYPQPLIARNTSLPFFVAAPKLFNLMRDTENRVVLQDPTLPSVGYAVTLNNRTLTACKTGDYYEGSGRTKRWKNTGLLKVISGIKTGNNKKYLRVVSSSAQKTFPAVDPSLVLSDEEAATLPQSQKENGILGTRHYVLFEMGMPSDTESGRLPCYFQDASQIAIDWSPQSVAAMHQESHSDLANQEFRFLPQNQQISFSFAGFYAPTFRTANAPMFLNAASRLVLRESDNREAWLGLLNSRLARFLMRTFVNHTVNFGVEDVKALPAVTISAEVAEKAAQIQRTQRVVRAYDYASREQLEIDRLVYEAYGLNRADIAEVETWYARRYPKLAAAQRRNLRAAGKLPNFDRWSVYCDETGHLAYDHAENMILGALLVPRERVRPLTLALRRRLAALGWPAKRELKWTKVSPAGLKFYEAALDFFLNEPDLRFRALIAPKSPPPAKLPRPPGGKVKPDSEAWKVYSQMLGNTASATVDYLQRHDAWYYDRYFDLLRDTLIPPAHHSIYVDVKDTRGGARIRALEDCLSDAHYDWTRSGIVEGVSQIATKDVLLDQLVDIMLGSLAWLHGSPQRNAGHRASAAKAALAAKLKASLDQPDTDLVPKLVIDHSPERSPAT